MIETVNRRRQGTQTPAAVNVLVGRTFMRLAFHFFLLFFWGAFPIAMARLGVMPLMKPILLLGGLFSLGLIASSKNAVALLNRCWPLHILGGLALISMVWSVNPAETANRATQLVFAMLLGVAMVARLGSAEALKLVIRSMSLICVLSVIWAVGLPDWGLHQATDRAQSVHAGLWRGVFSHKISLGTFGGLTFALLLFYGWKVFSSPLPYIPAIGCALACVLGSGSATGMVSLIVMTAMLFLSSHMAAQRDLVRRPMLRLVAMAMLLVTVLMFSGVMDQFATALGRSSDLTGRADYWPHVFAFVNSGKFLFGYGYSQFSYVGEAIAFDAGMVLGEAHNGVVEMVVAFGYVGAVIVVWVLVSCVWRSAQHLMGLSGLALATGVFPFSFFAALLVSSYAESIILEYRGVWTVLLPISVAISMKIDDELRRDARERRLAFWSLGLNAGRRASRRACGFKFGDPQKKG